MIAPVPVHCFSITFRKNVSCYNKQNHNRMVNNWESEMAETCFTPAVSAKYTLFKHSSRYLVTYSHKQCIFY